ARFGVDDDRTAALDADQGAQARLELRPEVGRRTRGDAGAGDLLHALFLGGARAGEDRARRLAQRLRLGIRTGTGGTLQLSARALADLPRGNARARGAAALEIDV